MVAPDLLLAQSAAVSLLGLKRGVLWRKRGVLEAMRRHMGDRAGSC